MSGVKERKGAKVKDPKLKGKIIKAELVAFGATVLFKSGEYNKNSDFFRVELKPAEKLVMEFELPADLVPSKTKLKPGVLSEICNTILSKLNIGTMQALADLEEEIVPSPPEAEEQGIQTKAELVEQVVETGPDLSF